MRPKTFFIILVLIVLWSALMTAAFAHTAPSGWEYPKSCCSGRDCAPVAPDAIRCNAKGCVIILPIGHPANDTGAPMELATTKQPRSSPDGENHACVGILSHVVYCTFFGGGS